MYLVYLFNQKCRFCPFLYKASHHNDIQASVMAPGTDNISRYISGPSAGIQSIQVDQFTSSFILPLPLCVRAFSFFSNDQPGNLSVESNHASLKAP